MSENEGKRERESVYVRWVERGKKEIYTERKEEREREKDRDVQV